MRTVMAPAGLGHLEQPAQPGPDLSLVLNIHWVSPHTAVAGLVEDGVLRLQALAAMVIVATFYWWLPILLMVSAPAQHRAVRPDPPPDSGDADGQGPGVPAVPTTC